jgi:hypothetical protein
MLLQQFSEMRKKGGMFKDHHWCVQHTIFERTTSYFALSQAFLTRRHSRLWVLNQNFAVRFDPHRPFRFKRNGIPELVLPNSR